MGGGNGGVSGHVEIVDTITKDVRSGVAGTSGGAGGAGVGMSFAWYSNNFGAWSGGGGGGGGAGGAAVGTGVGGGRVSAPEALAAVAVAAAGAVRSIGMVMSTDSSPTTNMERADWAVAG